MVAILVAILSMSSISAIISWMSQVTPSLIPGMARSQESELMQFTFKHSIFLVVVLGMLSMVYDYTF